MKISVLTPTYNRANLIEQLYKSLVKNSNYEIDIEWLIMDDGSIDETKEKVEKFIKESIIEIKYFYQENQGKMVAINNLVGQATGELTIECDSDDYFTDDAFKIIKKEYEQNKNEDKQLYGLCFLKYDTNGNNIGKDFQKEKTTMFDLYFKEGENGEKALVFYSDIRKEFKHELEHGEKFITEARMYHKMDENYKILCINKPIMICEYQDDGYTNNIMEQFKKYPFGYYMYFKEILQKDFKNVKFSKRLYAIKHFIFFATLIKDKKIFKNVNGIFNKFILTLLYVPGIIKTKMRLK